MMSAVNTASGARSGLGDCARSLLYEVKLYWGAGVWAALAFGLAVPWIFWTGPSGAGPAGAGAGAAAAAQVRAAVGAIELFGVAAAPLLAAALFSREEEGLTAEVLLSRPIARGALVARRVVLAVAVLAASLLAPAAGYLARGVGLPLAQVLGTAGPGALALAALGLAVGTLTGVSAAGYLVPLAYWAFDWATRGSHTGMMTLFARALGRPEWVESKLALLGAAAIFVGVAAWGLARRR